MAYHAILRNKNTQLFYTNKGQWVTRKSLVSVESKGQAYKMAVRLAADVVSVAPKPGSKR